MFPHYWYFLILMFSQWHSSTYFWLFNVSKSTKTAKMQKHLKLLKYLQLLPLLGSWNILTHIFWIHYGPKSFISMALAWNHTYEVTALLANVILGWKGLHFGFKKFLTLTAVGIKWHVIVVGQQMLDLGENA